LLAATASMAAAAPVTAEPLVTASERSAVQREKRQPLAMPWRSALRL
jgi:hypothetical protein